MDIKELKAMAYDQLVIIETAQANIRQINVEIEKKTVPVETVETEKVTEQ